MNAFFYYVPGRKTMDQGQAAEIGLGHLVGPNLSMPSRGIVANGPDGKGGVIFCAKPHNADTFPPIEYSMEKQTWKPIDGGKYWIAINNGAMPGPDDLKRSTLVPGRLLKLADKREWQIPCVSLLPMSFGLGPNGEETEEPQEEHTPMREAVDALYGHYFLGRTLGHGQENRHIAQVLSINYRVTLWELLYMRALSTDVNSRIAFYCLDDERFREIVDALSNAQKKMSDADTQDGSVTNCGDEGSCQDISQPTVMHDS